MIVIFMEFIDQLIDYLINGASPIYHIYIFSWLNVIQSTPVISNSKGLTETLRDIRTLTYQSWENEENNKLNNHI